MSPPTSMLKEVAEALACGRPVVALETTVVTHGLPQPQGVEIASELEAIVRQHGAVPATIAILDGEARIGLSNSDLVRLADSDAVKVNLGNLAAVLAAGKPGSTTVAATLALAHQSGIRVFATGGIGGVHRGATESGDVSADLVALSRFPLAVVCAGAKAILDLSKTVESLESLGVPILGYRTDSFPAFYRRESGLRVDARCDSAAELGRAVRTHFGLFTSNGTGAVVGNPVPREAEMPEQLYDEALDQALAALEQASLAGRAVTPFLLDQLDRLTEGRSVICNRALLRSNAHVAAELACELA